MYLKSLESKLNPKKTDFKIPPDTLEDQKSILFHYSAKLESEEHENYLISLLRSKDKYVVYKSLDILTKIYKNKTVSDEYWSFVKSVPESESYEEINQVFKNIVFLLVEKIGSGDESVRDCLLNDLVLKDQLLIYMKLRETQYNCLLIFWILSFKDDCMLVEIVPVLKNIIEDRSKEKILRVSYAILRNIIPKSFISLSNAYQILNLTEKQLSRNFKDKEFVENLNWVSSKLRVFIKTTSSIQNYLQEVFTGKLEESPYHYDDKFWELNVNILQENKIEILRAMKKYLKGTNNKSICIAANDIHRFLKVYPEAYFTIEKLGLKNDLFELSMSSNENIRFHAIQTLATCVFAEWSS
ncbi:putative V-type proton ATPase subunit H 1 [Dictyocoela muelleri]|nr:putative V-type proton ATPase subunit H 1 [Dictyocoela muelleri]